MGITGLLKGLGSLQFSSQKRHIRDFSNQTLAVDTSSWLHKSVYSVSERYVESLDRGRLDHTCVEVATKYIVARCQELLLHADIRHIYLVLDGKRCPLKAQTNQDREERRQKNLADARRFKQAGRPDKAQEKYKACIKISADMANAVAAAVTRRFANDHRVTCIYSPYEADAQLVKLCMDRIAHAVVTEDSDVLVYSASCNFSFPILYKLERDTGACDVITMDWLLNPEAQPNWTQPNGKKQNSGALEPILKSLVSRQSRHPGVGTRLFVQACVLAGCDYCPSQLNGVGLVTAFKLVRDNAHRPPTDRFRKALKSLSKKARANIDVKEYEELLSKSEAVFYYHPVLDMDTKNIIPLQVPRTLEEVNESELQIASDTHPSLHRFGGNWSFLGEMVSGGASRAGLKKDDETIDHKVPIAEIVIDHSKPDRKRQKKSKVAPAAYDGGDAAISAITRKVVNPYAKTKKRKLHDDGFREPLSTIGATTNGPSQSSRANPFAKFQHKKTAKSSSSSSQNKPSSETSMYIHNRQDPRFVKRNFRTEPRPYAKMLSEKGSHSKSSRRDSRSVGHSHNSMNGRHDGHVSERTNASSRCFETQGADGSVSMSRNSYQESSRHLSAPQHEVQNICEQEENSFCYSEFVPAACAGRDSLQEPIDESFSQADAAERHERHAPEMAHQAANTALPYGNPDLADDICESRTNVSVDQHSSARRVTLEDADTALYNEMNAAANGNRSQLPEEPIDYYHNHEEIEDDYHSQVEDTGLQQAEAHVPTLGHPMNAMAEDDATRRSFGDPDFRDDEGASSKYFQNTKRSARRVTREDEISSYNAFNTPHINGNDSQRDDPEDTIGKSTSRSYGFPFSSRVGPTRSSRSRSGNAGDCLSVSSCEDIASPDQQDKARPRYNDYSWTGRHSQEVQVVETPRQPGLAPIFKQVPQSTFVTGATPVEPRSPLSVTSPPPRNGSTLNLTIQSRPAFQTQARSRGRTKGAIRPKKGAITNFFQVKSSPPDDNEFARF